jgi:hypothetical protein
MEPIVQKRIQDYSLLELYSRYRERVDSVTNRDEALKLGYEIMRDFEGIWYGRGDSEYLATVVSLALPGGVCDYMDFYLHRELEEAV